MRGLRHSAEHVGQQGDGEADVYKDDQMDRWVGKQGERQVSRQGGV